MEKKIMLLVLLVLFVAPFSFSADLNNYVISSSVPLNQGVTATGISYSSGSPNVNQLCSFYFLNASTLVPVDRATDQYTDQTGRFFMPAFILTEPNFQRQTTYILKTVCGSNQTDANFVVNQRQEFIAGVPLYPQAMPYDLLYWTNPENSMSLFWLILGVLAIIGVAVAFKNGYISKN